MMIGEKPKNNRQGMSSRFGRIVLYGLAAVGLVALLAVALEYFDVSIAGSSSNSRSTRSTDPGCIIYAENDRASEMSVYIVIQGEAYDKATVDLDRKASVGQSWKSLEVEGQYLKSFIDSDDLYYHQYYDWSTEWTPGQYRVRWKLAGKSGTRTLKLDEVAEWRIRAYCN